MKAKNQETRPGGPGTGSFGKRSDSRFSHCRSHEQNKGRHAKILCAYCQQMHFDGDAIPTPEDMADIVAGSTNDGPEYDALSEATEAFRSAPPVMRQWLTNEGFAAACLDWVRVHRQEGAK